MKRPALDRVLCALLCVLLAACTVVYIEGDHNSISDTGGHGGGVALPDRSASSNTFPRRIPHR